MKKLLLLGFLTLLLLVVPSAMAKDRSEDTDTSGDVPEVNGDYPDPKNKDVRVRVFVHQPHDKDAKDARTVTAPVLACTDPDATVPVGAAPWHLPSSVTYRLNVSSVPSSVGSGNLPTIADNAFDVWQAAIANKAVFTRGANTTVARSTLDWQNIVAWGRTNGSALAVTYIRYYTASGLVADVDTIMNKKFQWRWTNPAANACSLYSDAYDAQDILTHEDGHWIGLEDEYTTVFVDHTMYGYGAKGELKKNTLTTGDILGAQAIYP